MQLLDLEFSVGQMGKVLKESGYYSIINDAPEYEFCLTTDGSHNHHYTNFVHGSTDLKHSRTVVHKTDRTLLPRLVGTYVEEVFKLITREIVAAKRTPGRWYLQRIQPVSVNPFRESPKGMTPYIMGATTHRCAMIVSETGTMAITAGKVIVVDSSSRHTHYNGHLNQRSTILVMESWDEN